MPILLRLSLVVIALVLAACGGGGSTTSQPPATAPALATLDAIRTGGVAASRREVHLKPGDAELVAAQDALGVPLPPSTVSLNPGAADVFVYSVTAVLSDGTTASYSFDDSKVPGDLQKLSTWLGTQF
jgi:hypothetical protein